MAESAILMPSRMIARLKERIEAKFPVVYVDEFASVSDENAKRIVGIAGWGVMDAALIDRLPALEMIAGYGVGYDTIDAAHAASKGIVVTNTPDVLSEEVADVTIGLLLNTVRELPRAEAYLRAGNWAKGGAYPQTRLTLRGRSVGIYGLGRIGLEIARRIEAFGLPVSYHSRSRKEGVSYAYSASLKELAASVDTLIVAVPGGDATDRTVDAGILAALGPDGVLINIGRGSVVDEPALIAALSDGTIAAAGLDVFADEPHVPEELLALPNASLLPHVASASIATRNAMADLAADNLVQWFEKGSVLTPVPECAHLVK
jgi:lactate dehydrogenase-like 2-hydroxyacid dehydrogenase